MCAVSKMHDYMRRNTRPEQWTRRSFNDFGVVLRLLHELDRKLDQHDCHDPEKAKWMEAVEKRLQGLEKRPQKKKS